MRFPYLLSRLTQMIVVLGGVSVLIFVLTRVLPGDPVAAALGDRATAEQMEKLRLELGLDLPLWQQYGRFVSGLFVGDMGMSLVERREVSAIIAERLPATLELIIAALFIAITAGVPLGVLAAVNRNGILDQISRMVALFGVSFPQFWVGIMLQLWLGLSLALLPITGRASVPSPEVVTGFLTIDSLVALDFTAFGNAVVHLICPALVLAAGPLATIMRMVRSNMIDEFDKPYPELARALGMHPFIIHFKYVLRNAFTPTLTLIGFLIPIMIGSSFVVEKVFAWPGLARFGADAIMGNDFNGVIGITLVICVFVVVLNLIVDLLYPIIDPRIRLGAER